MKVYEVEVELTIKQKCYYSNDSDQPDITREEAIERAKRGLIEDMSSPSFGHLNDFWFSYEPKDEDFKCTITKEVDWEDTLDGEEVRLCEECDKIMYSGFYCHDDFRDHYYCSEECLHKHYTEEEWKQLCKDYPDDFYWTEWED